MSRDASDNWIRLDPPLGREPEAKREFCALASRLVQVDTSDVSERVFERLERSFRETVAKSSVDIQPMLSAAGLVLIDLAMQKWEIRVCDDSVEVRTPEELAFDAMREKQRVREQELVARDAQLAKPSVRTFVQSMEKRREFEGRFVSIFSLMRDGRDLAKALRTASLSEDVAAALSEAIQPYIQFVDSEARCDFTGLRLQDIWRYFRHTWTNPYQSVPGRSMSFIVRDAAVPCHPVMGIGALSSPIVQIRERDLWIGWHPENFLTFVVENPSDEIARWLAATVDTAISELYLQDLLEDGLMSTASLKAPADKDLERLQAEGEKQRELHHRFARSRTSGKALPGMPEGYPEWECKARSHLYRSKRCMALAEYLKLRRALRTHFGQKPSQGGLRSLVATADGRRVVQRVLRKSKADRVGIAMADISVCGAVPPYGPILGGKLVSMLAVGPQVVAAYKERYAEAESEIASSMAGRAIVRNQSLVFIGTTSLYGVGSSQYNRVKIPLSVLGEESPGALRYQRLGKSESFGTSHFSPQTLESLVTLVRQSREGQRVNSIFGEGVSPRLRKVREGLDRLHFPTDLLLRHGRQRIVYGVSLIKNLREYLIGMDQVPEYLVAGIDSEAASAAISRWWTERWAIRRIASESVLEDIARNTLIRPVKHGARVPLPLPEAPLFESD